MAGKGFIVFGVGSVGGATKLGFGVQPSAVVSDASLTPAVTVLVQDAEGSTVVTDSTTSVTVALTAAGGATLAGTLTKTAVAGVATFDDLSIDLAATYSLTATAAGLTSSVSASFAVSAKTATKLLFVQQPSATVAGTAVSPAVTVRVTDAHSNTRTQDNSTQVVIALTTAGSATLAGTLTKTVVAGVATFSDLAVDIAATYTLTATKSGLTSAVSGNLVISFSPLGFPTIKASFKGITNAYTDMTQTTRATAYGDHVQEWHDEREAQGGSTYPKAMQSTPALCPIVVPTAFGGVGGGVYFGKNFLTMANLTGVATQDCTIAVVGCLYEDYIALFAGGCYVQLGTVRATGLLVGTDGLSSGTTNLGMPDAYYDSTLTTAPTVPLKLSVSVLTAQGGASNLAVACGGVSANLTAVGSATLANGYIGEDAAISANYSYAWYARILVYSPALSAAQLTALKSGLGTEVTLGALWPATYNMVIYHGNSLTEGLGHGEPPTVPADTYPYVCNATLTNPFGFLIASESSRTTAQLSTAHKDDIVSFIGVTRTGQKVVIFWEGHNDISVGGLTGAQVLTGYTNLAQAYKTAGAKVILIDIIKASDLTAGNETKRTDFNTAIKSAFDASTGHTNVYGPHAGTVYADYLIDLAADAAFSDTSNTTYYNADGVHLTPAGYAVVATYVATALGLAGVT